jgi:hypothetical protein
VVESTLEGPLGGLEALQAPPPSFTSSGVVTTSEGPSLYVALRVSGGAFVVASTRRPDDRIRAFRRTLLTVAAILGAWLLVFGWMSGVGARPVDP